MLSHPGGTGFGVQVCPAEHSPPHALYWPPHNTGPVQAHWPLPASAHICPLGHWKPQPKPATQPGLPSVVVVGQAREVLVVLVVVAEQQKPTSCGASCTSLARHAVRILTLEPNVPSLRCFAQRTAPLAASGASMSVAARTHTPTPRVLMAPTSLWPEVAVKWVRPESN
jgi:hypothetical protein